MQENRLMHWLTSRGISPAVIDDFGLCSYEHPIIGQSIKIPISDSWAKYRRDPSSDAKPKYIYDRGGKATLYGANKLHDLHTKVLITEGELDTLLAWSHNIPAVSSTGGANTFHDEWVSLLEGKDVIVAFDNDDAGAKGAVKVLSKIPHAKVVFIPEQPNLKDITDYVQRGGDLHELIGGAQAFPDIESVKEDRARRIAIFQSVRFHDAYIEAHKPRTMYHTQYEPRDNTELERAKTVPITKICHSWKGRPPQRKCIWHNEQTPSLTYYPNTNTVYCFGCSKYGDVIDVYRQIHGCDFKTALQELNKIL